MKAVKIKGTPWHLRVAEFGGIERYDTDICRYIRRFFLGLAGGSFLFLLGSSIAVLVGDFLVHALIGIWFSFQEGTWFFTQEGLAGMLLIGASIAGFMTWRLMLHYIAYSDAKKLKAWEAYVNGEKLPVKEPSFIAEAYRSWKGKYCFKVEFDD